VQNHLPDLYVATVAGRPDAEHFEEPIGPHPEQVRLLAYIALASGCQGLGFWSDRFLADSHHGRDRLQGMALLNTELDMVAPVLFTSDLTSNGLVVWWQDHGRKYARLAARWALDLAAFEYEKVRTVHLKLLEMGVQVPGADTLLQETHRYYREAQKHFT